MTCDDIQLLYEYDRWANERVLRAAAALNEEQFTRDLGGSFKSVRDTLVHIFGGEWIWLNYWKAPAPTFAFLAELRTLREALFSPACDVDSLATYLMASRIRTYVPQRQMLPAIAASISESSGCGVLASKAVADMI